MSSYKRRRQEIINNWLEGKESEDYDVIPTHTEGKYILRPKKKAVEEVKNTEQNNTEQNVSEENVSEENISEENNVKNNVSEENVSERTTSTRESSRTREPVVEKHNYKRDILNQLKLMNESFNAFNEERRLKKEKKQKKKEMKQLIHKEFVKNRVMVEGSDEEEVESEPQIVYVEKPAPVRIRRRLNLLDKFSPR